ncbi:MAG: metallo-beta-lactamase superfamily protein [Rhodoferax sp.]|nr:metallo-beta-lactamase superfamily protein [Rhodoferax sp.]
MRSALWDAVRPGAERAVDVPDAPAPVVHSDGQQLQMPPASGLRVTWFGHASSLVEIDGARVLVDPIWSDRASPVAWAGLARWYAPPIALQDLPPIDAVVVSHDHYDHLDRATIEAIARNAAWKTVFIVPLGIGAHLARWGVPETRIVELDWWQSARIGAAQQVEVVATPARHTSGRVSTSSNITLWAGFALVGPSHRAYYSGDTGFLPALAEVGARLGPFDVTLIEAGQYNADWPDSHLGPEPAVQAHQMLRGKLLIPVHCGLFKLAPHAWTEPVERVLAAARCTGAAVMTPRPGESVEPTLRPLQATARWWPALAWHSAAERPIASTRNGDPADRFAVPRCAEVAGR